MHRIEAGLLIPGHGDPVRDGVVVLDGPSIGYADLITLDADPLADIGVLGDPDRITAVWTRGRQVKGAVAA